MRLILLAATRQVVSVASIILNNNKIPPQQYGNVKQFFDKVHSDDTQKIVIKKI
jgi:hypothetical protein